VGPLRSTPVIALLAGGLGVALNAWAALQLFPGLDVIFGSAPVLAIALVAGPRAGLLAALVAGLGSFLLRGYPLAWIIYAVEAVAVGGLRHRAHPGLVVLGLWLAAGTALFAYGMTVGGPFGASLRFTALKNPLQEFLMALAAHSVLCSPAAREAFARWRPDLPLPRPTLGAFHLTYVGVVIGTTMLGLVGHQVRQIDREARAELVTTTATTARSIAAGTSAAVAAGAPLATVAARLAALKPASPTGIVILDPAGRPAVTLTAPIHRPYEKPWFLPILPPEPDVVAEAPIAGTGYTIRATAPFWVLHEEVDRTLERAMPAFFALLALLASLGTGLAHVLGREFGAVGRATERLAEIEGQPPTFPPGLFRETAALFARYAEVSASLRGAVAGLRTRDAELTLVNDRLATTVEELRALDRQRADVVSAMSHDIKIPLTAVIGYAEMLEDEAVGPLAPEQRELAARLQRNARRVVDMLDDLLDLAKLDARRFTLDPRPFDVRELAAETGTGLAPLVEERRHALAFDFPGEPAVAFADPRRVQQVLTNLVSNAVKYTPEGGHLRVVVTTPAGAVRVAVADDGPGIAEADLPHLFERFYRVAGVKAQGTGLGLAICKELVEEMGGAIGVDSALGRGTTFWFTLPEAPPPAA
jgi:signal transduction histidine kinase